MIGVGLLLLVFILAALLLGKVTLVMFAHPGMLLVGAGVLIAFLLLAALGVTFLSFQPHAQVATVPAVPAVPQPIVQVPQFPQTVEQISQYSGVQSVVGVANWVKFSGAIWLIFVIGCVVALVARRIFYPAACPGRPHLWPVLVLIPVLFLFWLGSTRYLVQVKQNPGFNESVRQATAQMNARQQQVAQHAREQVEKLQLEAQSRLHLAQQSIHDEMDQFDAPRIPLVPVVFAPIAAAPPARRTPAILAVDSPAAPKSPEAPKAIEKTQPKAESADK